MMRLIIFSAILITLINLPLSALDYDHNSFTVPKYSYYTPIPQKTFWTNSIGISYQSSYIYDSYNLLPSGFNLHYTALLRPQTCKYFGVVVPPSVFLPKYQSTISSLALFVLASASNTIMWNTCQYTRIKTAQSTPQIKQKLEPVFRCQGFRLVLSYFLYQIEFHYR